MQWEKDGYVVLRQALPIALIAEAAREVAAWRAEHPTPDPRNLRFRFKNRQGDGALLLDSIDPVLDVFPSVRPIAAHENIIDALEELLGGPVSLLKDKLVVKAPGIGGYPLHQDYIAWPGFPSSCTTVIVPLDAATRENGCVEIFPGMHRAGNLSVSDGDCHDLPSTAMRNVAPVALELEPGDIAIFGAFVPHRSGPNATEAPRRQLYLNYNRTDDGGDARHGHYETYRRWLRKRYEEFGGTGFYFD